MNYHYKLNAGQYVLHDGEQPIGPVLDQVSIAFDRESGTLHKHGSQESVSKWHQKTQATFRQNGFSEMADDLVVITGRFALEDLNRCLSTSGFVGHLYERLLKDEVKALDLGAREAQNTEEEQDSSNARPVRHWARTIGRMRG